MFFSSSPIWQTTGLTIIRVILGAFLIYHGWEIFNEVKMSEYLLWDNFKNSNGKLLVYAGKVAELLAGILFVLLALVFFFTGPGKYSVDHYLFKPKPRY